MLNIKELEHKIMSTADDNIPKKMATKKSKKANLLALTPEQKEYVKQQKFKGDGMLFRAKLIGIESVPQARGDKMCQEAMQRLKMIVKASGEHKQRITLSISLGGVKIIDERSGILQHTHPVHKISFISRDPSDSRAFGYVFGVEGDHKFYAIKTANASENVVLSLKDLFQVVFDMKTKEVEEVKRQSSDTVLYLKPMYDDEPPDEDVAEETHETVPATQNGEVSKEETIEALPTLGNTVTFEQEETTGGGNLVELENELKNIQMGIDAMEAFGDPFSAGGTTPDGTRSANKTPNPFEPADPFNMGGSSDFFSPQSDSSGFSSPPINQSSAMSSPSQDLFNPFQSQPGTTSTTTNLFAAQSVPQQQQQQQPIAYGQMGYGNMGQMGAPMGGNTMAAPMGGNPMIGTQMATNMALNAPTSYSMGSAMGGGYGGMSSHSQSYVPPPTQPVKPKADPFGDLDILGKSDSGVSDVFASLGARPARAPPPVPGKSTAAAPPVPTPRTNVGQQPPVDLFGSNMMTSPSGNDDFNLPSPDMPPPLPPRATTAAVNMSSELNNQPHVPPFVPPRLHGDNDLGIKDNVTHPIPIPSRIDNQHTNQQQQPQNRTETCESSGSAAAHFPNTFSLQESSASSNPSSLSSSACDSINNKTLSFNNCTTNSTSMTQSTQSTSLPINTLFDQHVLLSSSNPHADTNLSSSVPSACNNIANLFPQNDLFNTVTFTTAANTTNDVLLPVHEDPFADDPFTAESPTTSKIIVMDSSPVNHISSSSSSSSPPLSSSTGNPFVPAEGAVSKPDPFSVGGLTGGTSGSSNAFADQPFDAFDFGGGTAAPPSKTAPAQSSTFDNLDLFGGPAAEEPLYATVNKPKQ